MGLNWLHRLEVGLQGNKNTIVNRNVANDEKREKIIGELEDLFKNNHTIKEMTIDIQLKKDVKPIQQKGTRADPLPKYGTKNARETDRKGTPRKGRQDDRKLLCIPCVNKKG